jgi:metallo-beta-lactamase family protein
LIRPKLAFHGAAQTVTGSKYLLTTSGGRLMIDCGQFQGRKELRDRNWQPLPFKASDVDWLAITHAHIDHCGYLPRFVKNGFDGTIFCTPATAELLPIMLYDAAKLQEEDAAFYNRSGLSKHKPALPLFTEEDVTAALRLIKPVDYGAPLPLAPGVELGFTDVGHILGSSMIQVRADGTSILFSGDVGRYDMPLTPDPEPPPECEYLVIESTYGDRKHARDAEPAGKVAALVQEVHRTGGILLFPAFAVGRSQQLLYILRELTTSGKIPRTPIHVDSPMAFETTRLYARYMKEKRVAMDALTDGGGLMNKTIELHRTVEESRRLARLKGPAILIASSGMLTGGRILHHLKTLLPRESTVVAIVSYQAEGTRGRVLLQGTKTLRIFREEVPVNAKVVEIGGFSGHADCDELARWTSSLKAPKTVFVTHGEPGPAQAFAARLTSERGWKTVVPAAGQEFVLE